MKSLINSLASDNRMTLKMSLVLSLAAGLYIAALQPDILGFYHDDGVYAVTAKALAEGKGYRIISLPEEPTQMTYPIFYPLVLSVVWRIFPDFPANIPALKAPSIIFTLLFLWVTYLYLTRRNYASKRMALAIVFMTAVNPWTVWAATMAMSEALYSLVSVLALWATELFISSTWGSKRKRFIYLILAGMAIAVAIMTRSIGVSVLSATFIYLFLNKRRGPKDRRQGAGEFQDPNSRSQIPSSEDRYQGTRVRGEDIEDRRGGESGKEWSLNRSECGEDRPASSSAGAPACASSHADRSLCSESSGSQSSQLRLLHEHTGSTIHFEPSMVVEPCVSMLDISRHEDVPALHSAPQSAILKSQDPNPKTQIPISNRQSRDRRERKSSTLKKGLALGTQLELSAMFFLAPWLVWTVMQYINQTHLEIFPYRSVFQSYVSGIGSFLNDFGVVFFFKTLLHNLYRCFLGALPNMILPGIDIGKVISLNFIKDYFLFGGIGILGAFLSFTVILACVKDFLKKKYSIIAVYIILLFLVILLWPVEPDRFLIPAIPFILLFFLKGLSLLLEKVKGLRLSRGRDAFRHREVSTLQRGGARGLHLGAAPALFMLIFIVIQNAGVGIAHDIVNIVDARKSKEWAEKERLFGWIRENTQGGDILACMVSPAFYLYTGRKAVPPIVNMDLNDVSNLSDSIVIENFRNLLDYTYERDVYLVKAAYPYPKIYEQIIDRLAIKYPSRVSLRYVGKNVRYSIYAMK